MIKIAELIIMQAHGGNITVETKDFLEGVYLTIKHLVDNKIIDAECVDFDKFIAHFRNH